METIQACDRLQLKQVEMEKAAATAGGRVKQCECPCDKANTEPISTAVKLENINRELAKSRKVYAELQKRNLKLQVGLQRASKELLEIKYGPEPYFVELDVTLPGELGTGVLQLKMAPVDDMPYAVLYFLSHVSANAYDGCTFVSNHGHILMASIVGKDCVPERFRQSDVVDEQLAFQEYSTKYTHKKHTAGLAGRSGCC